MQPPPNLSPNLGQTPLLGQREAQRKAAIQAAVQNLSLGLYSQLAAHYISSRDSHQAVDPAKLRGLAGDSLAAARAYFEGVGVIETRETETNDNTQATD